MSIMRSIKELGPCILLEENWLLLRLEHGWFLTFAMEMVCCSMASWMATRSSSRIFSPEVEETRKKGEKKKKEKSHCQSPLDEFS